MTHELKILPKWFEDVAHGLKNFEIRKNDRDYKVGDILILKEFDGQNYTGRFAKFRVGYIYYGNGEYGVEEGYCIMGLLPYNKILPFSEWLKKYVEERRQKKNKTFKQRKSKFFYGGCL
ncbi:MAG: DUF3850 domain-containing protein [Lachnospiraceae bacterium]|nr:DUF3850 domain-containing protein [Lachnospiraceae bacterium]